MTRICNLVLGSAGYVGRSLVRYLQSQDQDVVEYDLRISRTQDLRKSTLNLQGIDRVYFLAWEVGGSKYLYRHDRQHSQLRWNLRMLTNVMQQLSFNRRKLLFVSSQQSGEYTAYGLTKQIGEYWTNLLGGSSVRLWNFYGTIEDEGEKAHVASDIITQALTLGKITLMTDGEEERWFTYESDACKGFLLAMENQPLSIYDIAGPQSESVRHIAEIVSQESNVPVFYGTKQSGYTDKRGPNYLPGYTPQIYLEDGIKKMIQRYREDIRWSKF